MFKPIATIATIALLLPTVVMLASAATVATDDDGNIVAAVPDGKKILFQEGGNEPIDVVNDITLARRATAENAACDSTVTGVVDTVAAMVDDLAKSVSTTNQQNEMMIQMLAQMVNNTANAIAASTSTTTNNNVAVDAFQAADISNTLQPSCMAYKKANPESKSGVYVLAAFQYKNRGEGNINNYPPGNDHEQNLKVYCDQETDGGGWALVLHEKQVLLPHGAPGCADGRDDGLDAEKGDQQTHLVPCSVDSGWPSYKREDNPDTFYKSQELRDRSTNPQGRSFAFRNTLINGMRTKQNQLSAVGYRITSNDNDVVYFGHEDCWFNFGVAVRNSKHNVCTRYTTKVNAKEDDWIQCKVTDARGMEAWEGCRNPKKETFQEAYRKKQTNVFSIGGTFTTKNGYSNRATKMIASNPEGNKFQATGFEDTDDVLLWVR